MPINNARIIKSNGAILAWPPCCSTAFIADSSTLPIKLLLIVEKEPKIKLINFSAVIKAKFTLMLNSHKRISY